MKYPYVLSEDATLDLALGGRSLARYGDGELKLILGKNCVSQVADPKLSLELATILQFRDGPCLPCIPNVTASSIRTWPEYQQDKYVKLYGKGPFGSSFITRPDSAPWIDRPDYWAKVESLWSGKDITLVMGTERSLRQGMLGSAKSIREVRTRTHRDAYAEVDQVQEEIGTPSGPVLLCLGATATVLAARLAAKDVHALDLGHIGMFMRHAGSYRHGIDALASKGYREQLGVLHANGKWGRDGVKHLGNVLAYADAVHAETVLDYGCGEATLCEAAKGTRRILNYDPGIAERAGMPKPVDLVVCTDVLEHVEPKCLDTVLDHIWCLAGRAAFLVIATRAAKARLPDGRNAHLIIQPEKWWRKKLEAQGWIVERADVREDRDVTLWLRK